MWELSKKHKTEIFVHFSDLLISGALFASSILSAKHADIFWGPWLGWVASLILFLAALWSLLLIIKEAETAIRLKFPGIGRWALMLIGLVYLIPVLQLFIIIGTS